LRLNRKHLPFCDRFFQPNPSRRLAGKRLRDQVLQRNSNEAPAAIIDRVEGKIMRSELGNASSCKIAGAETEKPGRASQMFTSLSDMFTGRLTFSTVS
jgi:hypothetical protein